MSSRLDSLKLSCLSLSSLPLSSINPSDLSKSKWTVISLYKNGIAVDKGMSYMSPVFEQEEVGIIWFFNEEEGQKIIRKQSIKNYGNSWFILHPAFCNQEEIKQVIREYKLDTKRLRYVD